MKLPPCDHNECGPSKCRMPAEWEGRLHGSDTWEDIWPEHDGQMSYGADITYVEIRRKGADALT